MNKKNMMLAAGLMLSVATSALPLGEQERSALYDLHALRQDFSTIGLDEQNLNMFIQLFEMNIKITENKLEAARSKAKSALTKTIAAVAALGISRQIIFDGMSPIAKLFNNNEYSDGYRSAKHALLYVINPVFSGFGIATTCVTFNLYDAFKTKNTLVESLALDKEILAQLMALKGSTQVKTQQEEHAEILS